MRPTCSRAKASRGPANHIMASSPQGVVPNVRSEGLNWSAACRPHNEGAVVGHMCLALGASNQRYTEVYGVGSHWI
jgi:hypothetical protein